MSHLLKIDNLSVRFDTPQGVVRAAERVSFFVNPGESLGLEGESGCGKSVTALSIPGLIPFPTDGLGMSILLTGTFQGCRFADRCPQAFEVCKRRPPDLSVVRPGHTARCWLAEYPEHRRRHDSG